MPNPNKQIILGMRFLLENEAIINLREGFVNLDGFEYEVSTKNHEANLYEQALIKKSKTFSLSEQEDKIEALILKAKRENPTFRTIPHIRHHINLHEDFNLVKREYPVPIGMHDEV
ncbi:hypothetical protein DMUE_4835 [Dictyocoela muelleri]|nr:hypothetical protein DMUE_4835 [Dictyocoela muelleri]